jgi:4'-phosphopantetheinyl transferase
MEPGRGRIAPPLAAPLDASRVDIWLVRPEHARERRLRRAYRALLSADARRRTGEFYFARDRHRHLVTRALVRVCLSQYAPVPPRHWTFTENEYGAPEIAGPATRPPLRFNVSHTDGAIACAVGLDRQLGVDVESLDRRAPAMDVASRWLAPSEVASIRCQPEDDRPLRFLQLWTLKEAYMKARGMGFSLPIEQIVFDLDRRDGIGVAFGPAVGDDPGSWHCRLLRPTTRHVLAIATRRVPGYPFRPVLRPCLPLRGCLSPLNPPSRWIGSTSADDEVACAGVVDGARLESRAR